PPARSTRGAIAVDEDAAEMAAPYTAWISTLSIRFTVFRCLSANPRPIIRTSIKQPGRRSLLATGSATDREAQALLPGGEGNETHTTHRGSSGFSHRGRHVREWTGRGSRAGADARRQAPVRTGDVWR